MGRMRPRPLPPPRALRLDAAVTHGDPPLGEIVHAQRIAEGLREFLEFEHFLGIGLFVDAMERGDAALFEILRRRLRWPRA